MVLLNTTFYIHHSIQEHFIRFLKDTYLPSALGVAGISTPVLTRLLLEPQDGMDGFALQLSADSCDIAAAWHDGESTQLRQNLINEFGEKVLFFTTYMEVIPL